MKTPLIILAVTLLAVPTLRAQIVNDGATNTLSNITTNFTGDVIVGTNGSFTLLILSDNALLTNSVNGVIGLNLTAKSNVVQLISPTARWQIGANSFVGSNGASSLLLVSNGGTLRNGHGYIGVNASASNNLALITGAGSVWSNSTLDIGYTGRGNRLTVSNGGVVQNDTTSLGFNDSPASNNVAVVTDSGSALITANELVIGFRSAGNQLVVSNGAVALNNSGTVGRSTLGSNNLALVTGSGSVWSNGMDLVVGRSAGSNELVVSNGALVSAGGSAFLGMDGSSRGNRLAVDGGTLRVASALTFGDGGARNRADVSNGGQLVSNDGSIGQNGSATSNTVVLTGLGSIWSNRAGLYVGNLGSNSRLVVSNGAAAYVGGKAVVGANSTANSVTVAGPGSSWMIASNFYVGSNGGFNLLVVSNGAAVLGGANANLGENASSIGNAAFVTGPNSYWSNFFNLNVGLFGGGNRLVAENGGMVASDAGRIGALSSGNEAVVTGAGSAWSVINELVVGDDGAGNRLVVTNGGVVRDDEGSVGFGNPKGSNNVALVTGSGSLWSNTTSLFIGRFGSGNLLVVSNGATAVASDVYVSSSSVALNNRIVVDGGTLRASNAATNGVLDVQRGTNVLNAGLIDVDRLLLTNTQGKFEFNGGTLITRGAALSNNAAFVIGESGLAPAVWDVRAGAEDHVLAAHLYVGLNNSSFNRLFVTNGALLTNLFSFNVGSGSSNTATISGPGSRCGIGGGISVSGGDFNRLVVSNGATLISRGDSYIGALFSGTNNHVQITGPGSVWQQLGPVQFAGRGNQLLVTDGGLLVCSNAFEGFLGTGTNVILVAGPGSVLNCIETLGIGSSGRGNQLQITNGALVTVGNSLLVGANTSSSNNLVLVDNGTLRVTNLTGTGLLEVRRGTNVLNSGLIETDILRMTNSLSRFEFNSGTLSVKSSRVSVGPPVIIGDGVNLATFILAGNGTHDFSGTLGLIVTNNATLTGNGSLLVQLQVRAGAQLVPGASVGKISLSTPPFFSGTIIMELAKNGTAVTNDQIQVTGTVTYGGALIVTNLGPTTLAAGDRFQLFNATAYAGSFTSISLPPLGPGLRWETNLLVDGSIEVFAPPAVGAGFALSFDGTNDFVRVSNDSRFNAYPLVATAWINTTQTIGEVGVINKYAAGSLNGWQVGLVNGEVRAWYIRDNTNRVWDGGLGLNGGPVNNGQWHHVAFTVDASGGHLYVDGFLKNSLAWTGTAGSCTTTQELTFARYPGGTGEFFKGMMDEVAVWAFVEQTQGEIKTNLTRGLIGSEPGLVVYHRFTEGSGTFVRNAAAATGDFASGILENGVTWVPGLVLRPAILTRIATAVTVNSAQLHGVSNPGFTNTSAWFEWGTTTAYGNVTPVQLLGSSGSNTNFSQTITGLTENATYHFRAVASSGIGASFGADRSFVATGTNMLSPRVLHTATLLPNGKVLVVGGQGQNHDPVSSAELYDPVSGTWAFTSPMSTVRYSHTATLLPNGKVLVAGGQGPFFTPALSSAELYDPATGTWTLTGSMATNRTGHTATLLLNGKVLVAGGCRGNACNDGIAELYDPATGTWTETGALLVRRLYHTASLLPNGKVLITGGANTNNVIVSSAELYDPVSATWTNTGSMTTNRSSHTSTLLRNGKVMVVGGYSGTTYLRSAELYDPITGTWTATGAMLNYRIGHTATLLPNGTVFASGDGIGVPSVYNPLTGTWADVPGPDPNSGATATLLPNGNVLVAGGSGGFSTDGDATAEAEVYLTPNNGTWAATAPMANARDGHTATLLPNALVLVASFTNSELYNPITGTWSNTAPLKTNRNNHTATLLPNGKVLVAGGINFSTVPGVELYDPTTGSWTNTGSMATNRTGGHTATLLLNGKVLVAGGNEGLFLPPIRSAELYDSATGNWTATGSMATNRSGHSATLLPDGKVLVAGGVFDGGFFPSVTSTAELYDPATGLWTAIPPMATNRSGHIAVMLPNGKVLVAGGSPGSLSAANASAELYDPGTGTWKATGSMITGRQGATATLLPNGKVLVAGGYSLGYLSSAELYDPTTGQWTATAALGAAHMSHTSTLLPTGKVLVTGGNFGSGTTNRAELYDVGLGFSNPWQPQILTATSPLSLGSSLAMTGMQFRGLSGGSGGNASQDSPTDYPLVQLRSLESARTLFVLPTVWSTNSFNSAPVSGLPPGWAMATVFVNGIPSSGKLLNLSAPVPQVTTSNASSVTATSATLNGVVNPNADATTAYFQWGTTTNYGSVTATTDAGNGSSGVAVAIGVAGLTPVTTYHFRMAGSNSFGLSFGADQNFTTLSTNANLVSLTTSAGILTPTFSSGVTSYTVFADNTITSATVTPTAADVGATIQVRVNGGSFSPVASGNASSPLAFNAGNNLIEVQVAAPDPAFTKTYTLAVTRLGLANHLIYADQLANGFLAFGGMTFNLANTSPVHSGSKSISATITSGGQELYFLRSAMDTTLYSSLSFWINGGPSGGQQLLVYGIVDNTWQSSYAVGPLPPNTWQHFTIPLALLGAANKTNFNGIVFQANSSSAQPTFYLDDIQLDGVQPPALVNVSVNATQIVRTVDARLFGVNAAAWDGDLDSPSTISVLTDMDNQVLRWPGGSWGDIYHESAPPNVGWGSYTSNFIHVATNTRAQVFMIANYGTGTPAEAADWVRYCNVTNQAGFKYWEIGNEVFGSWEEDHNTNAPFVAHDPWTYAMRFKDYYTQMKAVDPTIKIGAVAEVGEDNWANNTNHPALNPRTGLIHNGWVPVMLNTLKTNGVTPDFLIHHKYAPTGSDANNLLWSSTWTSDAASLRQMLTDYLGDAGTNTELVCTEHGPGGNKQKTSLVGGLFWADSLGQILQTEFNARVWWDLRNGQSAITPNPTLYGWRNYYDEGIVVGQAEPANRYPTFYCGKLMKYFARGGDQVVVATNDFPLLATYAVRRSDGGLSLLVINKSPYDALTTGISLSSYPPLSNATVYSYGIPQDEAARTNAAASKMDIATSNFTASANFTYAFPPYSATVFSLPARDFGVDVSHFQGESGISQTNWNQMFAEGRRFVFIKATEGLTGPHDATMATNVARASAAGLLVGVYHYAHPENRPTTNGAILEASNMVVYAGSSIGPGRLRPVLDLEGSAATLSTTALTDWVIAFCNEITARRGSGAAPIIYCSQTFANNELDSRLAGYDLWLRTVGSGANPAMDDPPGQGFADATGVFNNWSFWQYSATGSSGGLSPLDLNVCHSDFMPLDSFLITNAIPSAIQLSGLSMTVNGALQFSFTNTPGATFTVLATTNTSLPLANWTILGAVTETSPGQYQFTDPQATNSPQRYYRVRWP